MPINDFSQDGGPTGLRLALEAMGTRFELLIADEGEARDLRAAGEEAMSVIRDWHDRLSAFDASSIVSRINQSAGVRAVRVDADMLELLLACRAWHEMSEGAFDIALGSLMAHHGFRGADAAIGERPAFGMAHVVIDEREHAVMVTHPDVRLDLGAVAKGWAIDEACRVLEEFGVRSALLHGGTSTVRAIGAPPGAGAWRVRLEGGGGSPVVELRDAALSVSAPSGRTNTAGHGHVIDPRTGEPGPSARVAGAVVYNAGASDAWSTALLVLGRRAGSMPEAITSILYLDDSGGGRWDIKGKGPEGAAVQAAPRGLEPKEETAPADRKDKDQNGEQA